MKNKLGLLTLFILVSLGIFVGDKASAVLNWTCASTYCTGGTCKSGSDWCTGGDCDGNNDIDYTFCTTNGKKVTFSCYDCGWNCACNCDSNHFYVNPGGTECVTPCNYDGMCKGEETYNNCDADCVCLQPGNQADYIGGDNPDVIIPCKTTDNLSGRCNYQGNCVPIGCSIQNGKCEEEDGEGWTNCPSDCPCLEPGIDSPYAGGEREITCTTDGGTSGRCNYQGNCVAGGEYCASLNNSCLDASCCDGLTCINGTCSSNNGNDPNNPDNGTVDWPTGNLNLTYPTIRGATLGLDMGLPQLIKWLYEFIVTIAGIAAFVMMVWGGLSWLTSAGNPSKIADAKDRLSSALLGLLIILGSWLILRLINPDLTTLSIPGLD